MNPVTSVEAAKVKFGNNDRQLLNSLSATLMANGNLKGGMDIARFAQATWPADATSTHILAHGHMKSKNFGEVVKLLTPLLLTGRVRTTQLWLMLAVALWKTAQVQKAFDAARRFITSKDA